MATTYKVQDFDDIIQALREEMGLQATDSVNLNKLRRLVNMVYIDEVVPFERWKWLHGHVEKRLETYYSVGDATATPTSVTVTLSVTPNVSLGSFRGQKFSVDNFDEIYTIEAHTAGTNTLTLKTPYNGQLITGPFKIWKNWVDLPLDCRETVSVWHEKATSKMDGVGLQELRKLEQRGRKAQSYPEYYTTNEYVDEINPDNPTEENRKRRLYYYPAILPENTQLYIDYVKEVPELTESGDEPIIPKEDRVVLVFGAASHAYRLVKNDLEAASYMNQLYQQKLSRMAGKTEDSFDTAVLSPKSYYIKNIRRGRIGSLGFKEGRLFGASAAQIPTYAKDIQLEGGRITANFTVDAGVTIDGRDISEDGNTLDNLALNLGNLTEANRVVVTDGDTNLDVSAITSDELEYLDGTEALEEVVVNDDTAGNIITTWAASSRSRVEIEYSIVRGSNREVGTITVTHDGTNAAEAHVAGGQIGNTGVTLTTDLNSGNIRWLATVDNSGGNATIKYIARTW